MLSDRRQRAQDWLQAIKEVREEEDKEVVEEEDQGAIIMSNNNSDGLKSQALK